MAQDHLPASNMNGLTPKKKSCSERTDHELPSWTPTFASFTNSDPPSTSHSVSAAAGFNTTMSEWTSTPSTSSTHRGERLGFAGPGLKSLHESKIIKVTFVTGVYGPSFPPIFFWNRNLTIFDPSPFWCTPKVFQEKHEIPSMGMWWLQHSSPKRWI